MAERWCESVMYILSMYSAYADLGVAGGGECCLGIITHDLQLASGMENGWNCHTRILKHLTNLRLGLRRSPGINELVFVVKYWERVGQCWINH